MRKPPYCGQMSTHEGRYVGIIQRARSPWAQVLLTLCMVASMLAFWLLVDWLFR